MEAALKAGELEFIKSQEDWSVHTKQYLKDDGGDIRSAKAFSVIDDIYADRKGMEVLQVFSITESSTKGDRPEFERMIAFIAKQKKRTALIVDCLDRLQRSFTHIPVLNMLMEKDILEIHFIREGYSIDKDSNSMQS